MTKKENMECEGIRTYPKSDKKKERKKNTVQNRLIIEMKNTPTITK